MRHTNKLNIMRVIAIVMTLLVLSVQWMPAVSAAEKGSCGKELTWSFSAGTLTISGKGDMDDYNDADLPPWDGLKGQIRRLILPDGLASIGNCAFYECKNLTTVQIPDSVKDIGAYAFGNCESLVMLTLGSRVSSIGTGAFRHCTKLDGVRLPYGLTKLGDKAFYRCESLSAITIPQEVRDMGTSVFAYCTNLVTATCYARIKNLPQWTFYGCINLTGVALADSVVSSGNNAFTDCQTLATVYYSGSAEHTEALKNDIARDIVGFDSFGYISDSTPPSVNYAGNTVDHGDGTITQTNTSVREENGASVVTQVTQTRPAESPIGGEYSAEVKVTLENKDAWSDALEAVTDSLKHINDAYATEGNNQTVNVIVYMKDTDTPNDSFVKELVGRDVEVTVVAPNGSSWQLDCSELKSDEMTGEYNFSYTLHPASDKIKKKLKTDSCYELKFLQSAKVNAELLVQLPSSEVNRSNAFLYQIEKDGSYTRLQAVKIDQYAVAHFYLASVDKDTGYVIGINVPGEKTDDLIIPDELASDYGGAFIRVERIEYVATGAQSSWGLTFWQVTLIMIGVLVGVIILVGCVMTYLNKRRLIKESAGMPQARQSVKGNVKSNLAPKSTASNSKKKTQSTKRK